MRDGPSWPRRSERRLRPTTVNRELSVLRRAFKLGQGKLGLDPARLPVVEMLPESEPRSGFVEPDQFEAVVAELPDYLQDLARYGYLTGWRSGAIRSLRWDDINGDRVTLRREHSKNRKSYTLPLRGDLAAIIERRREARTVKQEDGTTTISELVFHRGGQPIGDFGKAWISACLAARLYTVLTASEAATTRGVVPIVDKATNRTTFVKPPIFHDLRRSAARNLRRAGIGSDVGRKITGHETTSMWTRYSIVDETDVAAALDKVDAFVTRQVAQAPRKVIAFPQR